MGKRKNKKQTKKTRSEKFRLTVPLLGAEEPTDERIDQAIDVLRLAAITAASDGEGRFRLHTACMLLVDSLLSFTCVNDDVVRDVIEHAQMALQTPTDQAPN